MDYKDKYNKLVNAIKVLQETNQSDEGIQNWVNDNVPELAESQDEKVRKWLYGYFHSLFPTWIHPDITCGEILAWLEKQGEPKSDEWSEEDEKNISTIRIALRDAKLDAPEEFESYGRETTVKDFENAESWLKSIKERIGR